MQFKTRRKRNVLINITPLIDVLFLLLIFFMVSSTFLEQPGIKLELPVAESAEVVEQKEYVLFVDQENQLFLNDRAVELEALEGRIKEALAEMKDGALVLKADREVSHGIVVRVMDAVKRGGVRKLIIGTKVK